MWAMRCSEKYPRKNKTQKIASRKFTPWEIDAQENCPLKKCPPPSSIEKLFHYFSVFLFKIVHF